MPFNFTTILDLLGTFAFALSGIRLASGKKIDWFGAYVIGLVTAIGGGTIRDLLLDLTPFWMLDPKYFITTGLALMAALLFKEKLLRLGGALFLFDAIGLGLFTIVGIAKSIVMGTITGCVGGVIRDVLLNEVPLLFRGDIYALACIAGGLVYFTGRYLQMTAEVNELVAGITVIVLRLLAVKFHLHVPELRISRKPNRLSD